MVKRKFQRRKSEIKMSKIEECFEFLLNPKILFSGGLTPLKDMLFFEHLNENDFVLYHTYETNTKKFIVLEIIEEG